MKDQADYFVLIYFRGCSSLETARELLKEVGFAYEEVRQDDLPKNHDLRHYSSPSLLRNGEIVFGARLDGEACACSIGVPTEYQLLSRIYG
jgi:hypothetical protein